LIKTNASRANISNVGFCKVSRIHVAKENCGLFLGKASAQKVFPAICIPGVKRPDAV
jgi:hypothetical protein